MLYWIWFSLFSGFGFLLAYLANKNDLHFETTVSSIGLLALSLYVSWPVLGVHVYDFLDSSLPNAGESIHTVTAVTIIGILSFLWVLLPVFGPSLKNDIKTMFESRHKQPKPN